MEIKTSNLKVLLAQPLWPHEKQWGRFKKGSGTNSFSYGLASIAAIAEKNGFSINICDTQVEGMSKDEFVEYLSKGQFDIIGMPCYTASASYVFYTARICKEILPQCKIILGSIHPTILPRETLNECSDTDVVVIGEGEYTFCELLNYYRDGKPNLEQIQGIGFRRNEEIIINPRRPFIRDLDNLPMPAYHLFPMQRYIPQPTIVKKYPTFAILASRGCPYSCSFCNARDVHGKKVRHKSVGKIIKEIKFLRENYNARGITFQDKYIYRK
ncbi:2-hydroxyethylphosphonate methyltransferase [subsurface metagenome]